MCAILGPNGAGKSTLLRLIAGTFRPHAGEITFNGRALAAIPARRLALERAVLSQNISMDADFSVAEVVCLGRTPHTLGARETRQDRHVCEWALGVVGMGGFVERRFGTLSGGEKQRVHLARVLAQLEGGTPAAAAQSGQAAPTPATSRWLLLDEPTSALDLRHQHDVLALTRRLSREAGFGVIAVLHDLNLALRYADSVLLLSDGRVAAAGPTRTALTCDLVNTVYGVRSRIFCAGHGECPFIQTEALGHTPPALQAADAP